METPIRPTSPQPIGKKGSGPALLREVITTALQQKSQGDLYNYQFIIHQIRTADAAAWRKWLLALTSCVSALTKENHELVAAALGYEWTATETDEVFIGFLIHLSSSSSYYVNRTILKLISHIVPVMQPGTNAYDAARTDLVLANVHRSFQHILHLIPTSSTAMLQLLVDNYPHRRREKSLQHVYLKAILDICTYVPPFRDRLFALAIEKAVQVDAEIKVEEAPDDEQFETDEDLQRHKDVPEMAAKLDDAMELLFRYVTENEGSEEFFRLLLRIFETVILPTHKSKYTQFLLFYACSKRTSYLDAFVSALAARLFNPRQDGLTRQTCAAYLASFLARAAYVPTPAVRHVLTLLVRSLHEYVAGFGQNAPDAEVHGVFYATCQAVLYIFCFHARSILAADDGRDWFAALNLGPIFICHLNPFKVCFQVAVLEFVKITEAKELMTIGSAIIEQNRRLILPKTVSGRSNAMDAFFPFDPYLLRTSSAHLDGLYLEWEHGADDDDDGSENKSSQAGSQGIPTPGQTPQCILTLTRATFSGGSLPDEARSFSLDRAMDTNASTPVSHSPSIPISETLGTSPQASESYSMR